MKTCVHCGEEFTRNDRSSACTTCKNGIHRYGLTKLQQIELYEHQNRKCLLCDHDIVMFATKNTSNSGCIDHDHKTNKVRGILCHPCNTILGYVERKNLSFTKMENYIS